MLVTLKAILVSSTLLASPESAVFNKLALHTNTPNINKVGEESKGELLTGQAYYARLIEDDNKRANELLQEACSLGYGRACWYYSYETEKPEDIKRAQAVLQQSCFNAQEPSGQSCTFLGILVSHSVAEGIHTVKESERELYERACSLDDGWGCYLLARDYITDEDARSELMLHAARLTKDACEAGSMSNCYFAGSILNSESWINLGKHDAQYFYERGCKLGDGDSCTKRR